MESLEGANPLLRVEMERKEALLEEEVLEVTSLCNGEEMVSSGVSQVIFLEETFSWETF